MTSSATVMLTTAVMGLTRQRRCARSLSVIPQRSFNVRTSGVFHYGRFATDLTNVVSVGNVVSPVLMTKIMVCR